MSVVAVIKDAFDYPPGPRWVPYSANKVYSIQQRDTDNFDFQVRGDDRYLSPAYSDPAYVMRSEVIGPFFSPNTPVTFNYRLTVAPGVVSTNAWMIFGQLHSGDDVLGASPVISLNVLPDGNGGETAWINLNHRSAGQTAFQYDRIGSFPFKRGVAYDVSIMFVDARGGPYGRALVYVNGIRITDYTGVTGYNGQITKCYPKFGIYAGGKGPNALAMPDPNQQIIASYYKPIFLGS